MKSFSEMFYTIAQIGFIIGAQYSTHLQDATPSEEIWHDCPTSQKTAEHGLFSKIPIKLFSRL